MGVCWKLRLKASNKGDAEKLVAYAKELNNEFCLEPYSEETMDGLEFCADGFCFSEVKEDSINRFYEFLDRVVAHFPDMDMEYRQVGDDTHTSLFVNKNGQLERYTPGTMYIYTENATDYTALVGLAEKNLKEHGFVMGKVDDEQKTISWEYEFDNESSKEKCDAVIASISKAMPSTRLVCYCVDNLVLETDIERYCYVFGGDIEWVENPGFFYPLYGVDELYTMSELVSDPVGCYEKLLTVTRSVDHKYGFYLILALCDINLRAELISKLSEEDRTWILEKAGNSFVAEEVDEIVKVGLITAEDVAQRIAQMKVEREQAFNKLLESGNYADMPF